jgi:hypothetical protein
MYLLLKIGAIRSPGDDENSPMEREMSRSFAAAIAGAVLMGLAATATAAPSGALTGAGEAVKSDAQASGAEAVRYTCWWSPYRGRVCSWYRARPQVYGFYSGPRRFYGHSYGYRRHW